MDQARLESMALRELEQRSLEMTQAVLARHHVAPEQRTRPIHLVNDDGRWHRFYFPLADAPAFLGMIVVVGSDDRPRLERSMLQPQLRISLHVMSDEMSDAELAARIGLASDSAFDDPAPGGHWDHCNDRRTPGVVEEHLERILARLGPAEARIAEMVGAGVGKAFVVITTVEMPPVDDLPRSWCVSSDVLSRLGRMGVTLSHGTLAEDRW